MPDPVSAPGRAERVLVVVDDPIIRQALAALLVDAGYRVEQTWP